MSGRRIRRPGARPLVVLGSALLSLVGGAPAGARAQGVPVAEACVACHLDQQEERLRLPAELFEEDVHAQSGFGCLDCHGSQGGDPVRGAGFLTAPSAVGVPAMCGRCHSDPDFMRDYDPALRVDQVAEYYTSRHGRLLREEGDTAVATCVSCHPAHDIRPPNDPKASVYPLNVAETCGTCHADEGLMGGRDHDSGQLEAWRSSVHGRLMIEDGDVSAPTCNDCHGNHGATPPGVTAVQHVCGQCHATMESLFTGSGHDEHFSSAGLPGCTACHGNHAIQETADSLLEIRNGEVCQSCHPPGTDWAYELNVMAILIDSLKAEYARSDSILDRAENLGMEVSQSRFELEDANTALTKARAAIHAFVVEPVADEVRAGLAVTSRTGQRGTAALEEHDFRRMGLAASVGVILLLVLGLALKIREIERTETRHAKGSHGRD